MKKIMILGGSILQLPAIEKARNMGLEVIVVDMNPNAIGFQNDRITKEVISTTDIPAVLEVAKKHKIDGIMTLASDMPIRTIARVSREMGVAGITEETAFRATDKLAMRKALSEYNVPIPQFYKVTNEEEFFEAVDKISDSGFRVITKPADNSGSRGVELLSSYNEDTLKKAFLYSKEYSRSGNIIVEEYMEGPEVSVETLTIDGECHVIQITDKMTTGAPYFVEVGHSQPSMLQEETQQQIRKIAVEANKAIGITNGPSHTEIKVTADGPKIVEIGARLGGDNITTHLVPLSTGVDMVEACILLALGEKCEYDSKFSKGAAIRYFDSKEGIIDAITGVDIAKKLAGVKQINFNYSIGGKTNSIHNSIDRVGFVIVQSETAEKAVSLCTRVNEIVKIKYKVGVK